MSCVVTETPSPKKYRRPLNRTFGIIMFLLALGHMAWLEFGPERTTALTTGDAASLAGSLLMAGLGVMMIRDQ